MPAVGDQHRGTPSVSGTITANPFEEGPRRMSEYTAQEIATLQARLDKQLGPEYISSRAGPSGQKVHYLAAEKCINLANEVFGFNGWSSSIQSIQIDFVDESPNTGKISLGLSVIIRVTLRDGTYHEDVGYGHIENCKGKAAAFEKAKKEGTTDGLKRALRTFGNVLGNCVYDKEYLAKVTRVKVAPTKWDVENLHRHPQYGPVKKEPTHERKLLEEVDLPSLPTTKCNASHETSMTVDGDGEFGSDVFDEADFVATNAGNPDEVSLDVDTLQQLQPQYNNPQLPPAQQRSQGNFAYPAHLGPNTIAPSKPERSWVGGGPTPTGRPVPHNHTTNSTTANPPRNAEKRQVIHGQAPIKSRSSQETQPTNTDKVKTENPSGSLDLRALNSNQMAPSNNEQPVFDKPAMETTVGFYSARAVDTLRENPQASPMAPKFDPHAESPSIRKTAGIDHTKSVPISKPMLSGTSSPTSGTRDFINPSTDIHRRIGAPGGNAIASPVNRGFTTSSYRPLTRPNVDARNTGGNPPITTQDGPLKRPPLGDVTNAPVSSTTNGGPGPGDPKRPRLDEGAHQAPPQPQQQ
ncbi:hypothetical protein BGW36DRAFT_163943 [Talaromyces proteolyticus]|uniref:RAD52 homolog n=1 Tax=Talaromyces proteolyticus TaxID=1131652 RepID=A0AAD4PY10_9EURO|nr:uncharacterized protein BGW36DRAFT_163943 [Talaromyces proteolyticus]KAH8697229.1 hypothetical protein BGW36DRAFT_163943 [Talaromyces proteolyticus]